MIPSSEQPAVLITAAEYQEGKATFRHDYILRGGNSLWRIEELSFSREHASPILCSFVVGVEGYSSIRIKNRVTGFVTGVTTSVQREPGEPNERYIHLLNAARKVRTEPKLLFDGPNPLFNYFNAMHLLGVTPGEERVVRVQVCDAEGGVHEERYGYFFDGTKITVDKGRNQGTDILELDERYALRRVTSENGEIVFSRYSAMFLN